jgi:hypothetical protein
MNEQPRLSRRAAFSSVASGIVLGTIWGATFPIVASENRPSLIVIGHHSSQIVLVDSGEARALVFLGVPDDALIERIPSMMTLFRQRIDIVIGTKSVLEQRAIASRSRWKIRHAIMMSGRTTTPGVNMPTTVISDSASIDLGRGMTLRCSVGHRNEWLVGNAAIPELWMTLVSHPSGDVALVPDEPSIEALGPLDATLIVMPEPAPSRITSMTPAKAIAINYDSDAAEEDAGASLAVTRIYPQDIARFPFGDDGIELPAWTETAVAHRPPSTTRIPKG